MLRAVLVVSVAGLALVGGTASAQTVASSPQAPVTLDIPAGSLGDALIALGRQAKVQIAFLPDRVAGRNAPRLRGTFTVEEALKRLLRDSGLRFQRMQNNNYTVGGPNKADYSKAQRLASDLASDNGYANGEPNIPDILVTGHRTLTLNTDIPRGEDEAQPYSVFSREQIKRSGALNLEDFLRDNLGANTSIRTARQGGGVTGRDSLINLRGMGNDSTLILVDGRRTAEPNSGVTGAFVQSSVVGIPLEQIERVEVLASSAAGQYGSNAVGGVINVILRRDFQGIEAGAYVSGSTRGDAIERRLSLNATFPIAPKTSLTLSGSWKKSDPLYAGDRSFVNERLAFVLRNNPRYLETAPLIYSTTPNIRSTNGALLVLKPQFALNGVTALGSAVTFIPEGYRGLAQDGVAALIANAGRQNVEPGPGDTGSPIFGDRSYLLTGGTIWNASATARSDLTDWFSLYGSATYSKNDSTYDTSAVPASITYQPNSPLNPFTTAISVSFPSSEPFTTRRSTSETTQFIGGVIVKLPYRWQANVDVNASFGTANAYNGTRQLSAAYYASLVSTPTIDVLRDTLLYPIAYQYETGGHYSRRDPSKSSATSYTARLAGPLGFARLWGGKPLVTLVGEVRRQWFDDSVAITDGPGNSTISFSPERSLNTKSAFGELVLPIVGADNHVPLMYGFELRLSARYDSYEGRGANVSFQCVNSHPGTLTEAELNAPCPSPTAVIPYRTVRNDTFNPVIAAKWSLSPDIALRGSYSTGYTPPQLNNIVENNGLAILGFTSGVTLQARDPLRGNERIGTSVANGLIYLVEGITGGNPDIEPQLSKSWSFGTILTPRFLPGLTLRADWTKIVITNGYFSPQPLLLGTTTQEIAQFNDFLAAYPDRFRRGPVPAGDPYGVGPITYVNATTANLSRYKSESIDFSGNYETPLGEGLLQINGTATVLLNLTTQLTPSAPVQNLTGVVAPTSAFGVGDSLKFRGVLNAVYSTSAWNIGARIRHFSGYYLNFQHAFVLDQGSNRVPSQTYYDLFGGVRLFKNSEVSISINNILDKRPPIDATRGLGYAPSGDPRLRNFAINLTQRF